MLQNGEVLSAEILPKVADEMKKVAGEAGALEAALQKARVAQGRFNKALEVGQNEIFNSGFDTASAGLFNQMAESIDKNSYALKQLGNIYSGFFKLLTFGVKIVTPVLDSLFSVTGNIMKLFENMIGTNGGKLALGLAAVAVGLSKINVLAKSTALRFFAVLGVLDEIVSLFVKGRAGFIERMIGGENYDMAIGDSKAFKSFVSTMSDLNKETNGWLGVTVALTPVMYGLYKVVKKVGGAFRGIKNVVAGAAAAETVAGAAGGSAAGGGLAAAMTSFLSWGPVAAIVGGGSMALNDLANQNEAQRAMHKRMQQQDLRVKMGYDNSMSRLNVPNIKVENKFEMAPNMSKEEAEQMINRAMARAINETYTNGY